MWSGMKDLLLLCVSGKELTLDIVPIELLKAENRHKFVTIS
jgi:hypothetical protein